jgi:hypothetical protein
MAILNEGLDWNQIADHDKRAYALQIHHYGIRKGIRGNETFKRARMAVSQAFSEKLDSLVQISFTKPVYAGGLRSFRMTVRAA